MHARPDAFVAVNDAPGWKIGRFYEFNELINGNFFIVDISDAAVNYFRKVVRHHIGSHAHGNTTRSVHKQLRYPGGENGWLLFRIIKIRLKIYRIFFYVVEHMLGQSLQPYLGVPHCSRTIAILVTEVT